MKEKIKTFIYNTLIFYSIIIIVLITINLFNTTKEIELYSNDENNQKYLYLKNEISKLEESSCKTLLNEMITTYETTNYNGIIKLSDIYEYYWNGKSFLDFYNQIKENCNISEDTMKKINMPEEAMESIIFTELIVQKYMFQYEINIKDINMRKILESDTINFNYNSSKSSELQMIEKVLNYIGEKNE